MATSNSCMFFQGKMQKLTIYIFLIFVGCTCDPKGAEQGDQCAHKPSGECRCMSGVIGFNCDRCGDGYYGFGQQSTIACKSKITSFQIAKVV